MSVFHRREKRAAAQIGAVSSFLVQPRIWLKHMREDIAGLANRADLAPQLDRIEIRLNRMEGQRK